MAELSNVVAYLGCPYSHPDPAVRAFRLQAATQMVYDLRVQGVLAYSPLTHNMPVDRLGVFGDFLSWLEFDHAMLSRCNKLFILKIPGWESSKGLSAEIEFAKKLGLPIEALQPEPSFLEKVSVSEISAEPIPQLLKQINQLVEERDWDQFHSPKNLAMNLQIESSEIAEHFVWLTEAQSQVLPPAKKQEVAEELGDVLISLVQLSDKLGIDLLAATMQKINKIKAKYPVALSYGKALKYTNFSESSV